MKKNMMIGFVLLAAALCAGGVPVYAQGPSSGENNRPQKKQTFQGGQSAFSHATPAANGQRRFEPGAAAKERRPSQPAARPAPKPAPKPVPVMRGQNPPPKSAPVPPPEPKKRSFLSVVLPFLSLGIDL